MTTASAAKAMVAIYGHGAQVVALAGASHCWEAYCDAQRAAGNGEWSNAEAEFIDAMRLRYEVASNVCVAIPAALRAYRARQGRAAQAA